MKRQLLLRDMLKKESKKHKVDHELKFTGYDVVKTLPNGSCMFQAIAHQLSVPSTSASQYCPSPAEVRKTLVQYLRLHPDILSASSPEGYETTEAYLKEMEKDTTWGDGIILAATYRCYGRPVTVVYCDNDNVNGTGTSNVINLGQEEAEKQPIFLGFVRSGSPDSKHDHYVSLVPIADGSGESVSTGLFSGPCQNEQDEADHVFNDTSCSNNFEARRMDTPNSENVESDSDDNQIDADASINQDCATKRGENSIISETSTSKYGSCASDSNVDVGLYVNHSGALSSNLRYNLLLHPWRPAAGFTFPHTKSKTQTRYFKAAWLDRYSSWLVYSKVLGGALCRACVLFAPEFSGKGSHQKPEQFVTKACTNWKDFHKLCSLHMKCKYHNTAVELAGNFIKCFKNADADIIHLLDKHLSANENKTRKALLPIVKTVLFCGRQGLALRGHQESGDVLKDNTDNDGNFRALLRFRVDSGDHELQTHLQTASKNALYISPHIQNEIIACAGKLITDQISARVNAAKSFSILADETTDSSCKEQLSVGVRYVHYDCQGSPELREDFIGFLDVSADLTANGISSAILHIVSSAGIDLGLCHGQGYDGAAAMSGHLNGVQALIRKSHPLALYTHCASHCLNLALGKACSVPIIRNSLGAVSELVAFFSHSPQRSLVLQETVQSLQEQNIMCPTKRRRLIHLCETRWVERHESIVAVVELFPAIVNSLETMQIDGNTTTSRSAGMLLSSLRTCTNIIGMLVAQHISSLLLPLTTLLQAKCIDFFACCSEVGIVVSVLKENRETSDTFTNIFSKFSALCDVAGTEVTVPRLAGHQRHRGNVAQASPLDYYRVNVFNPFLDYLVTELNDRFLCHQSNAFTLQCLVPKFCCTSKVGDVQPAITLYQSILEGSPSDVEAEFELWRTACVKGTVSADNAFDALQCCPSIYPNIKFLLQILATLPVTTASAERSFSMLRRLKTWLRSFMCQDRLNGLGLLASATDIDIRPSDVVDRFLCSRSRRLQ